jgi:hypothetical protein
MRYLCAVYFDPKTFEALSAREHAELGRASSAYDVELSKRGCYIVAEALQPVHTAKTVRVRKRRRQIADGPFAETKEHLGGFILIQADDMDSALAIAAGIPLAKLGTIEVRPVMDFSSPPKR